MSARNRVVWNEGLFIKPQHFQQQQRNSEYQLDERIASVSRYLYGITEMSLNPEYLSFGRIALDSASGVMLMAVYLKYRKRIAYPMRLRLRTVRLLIKLFILPSHYVVILSLR